MKSFRLVPDNIRIGFSQLRVVSIPMSALLVLVSILSFAFIGPNYGTDFLGGVSILVETPENPADISSIRSKLADSNLGQAVIQTFGKPNQLSIRLAAGDGSDEVVQATVNEAKSILGNDLKYLQVRAVGASVSRDLVSRGILAITLATLGILIYVWFRFEWQFSVAAIIAIIHDVCLTLGMYVVTGLEFNISSITALLAIIGYSLNDTVVVFDRVREILRSTKNSDANNVIDLAVNQTLSRTVATSVTTLIALAALFFLGGEIVASFTGALVFGVLVGTFSSVFIASPILVFLDLKSIGISDNSEIDPYAKSEQVSDAVEGNIADKTQT